jgi:enterobactin synthetase component D
VRDLELPAHLFPPDVAARAVRVDVGTDAVIAGLSDLDGIPLPASLAGAVPKRRLEYLAGRYCARAALRDCAHALADEPIGQGQNREPLWPAGAAGSIAHTTGYVVAAASASGRVSALGVDVERWMDEDAPRRIGAHIATDGELVGLCERTGWSSGRALTLVFSAKETLYKCLYPEVRRYFGFHDARVESLDPDRGAFAIALTGALEHLPAGLTLEGRFEALDDVVLTSIVRSARR